MSTIRNSLVSYLKEGFLPFSSPMLGFIKVEDKKDPNKIKKIPHFPPEWPEFTPETVLLNYKCCHKTVTLITGSKGNLSAIDFDSIEAYELYVDLFPILKRVRKVKTRKGYHCYFKYDQRLPNGTNKSNLIPNVDIRNDGGCLFAPPTSYFDGVNTIEYTHIAGELIECPLEIIETFLKSDSDDDSVIEEDSAKPQAIPVPYVEDRTQILRFVLESDRITDALDLLSPEKIHRYDTWITIGMALKNDFGDLGLKLWFNVSKKSPSFVVGECEEKWLTFNRKGLTTATIFKWLKNDEIDYSNIRASQKLDENHLAKYIALANGNKFICQGNKLYHFNGNVWSSDSEYIIDRLIPDSSGEIYLSLHKIYDHKSSNEIEVKTLAWRLSELSKLGSYAGIQSVKKLLMPLLNKPDIKFNQNLNLFCFNNQAYDLVTHQFRKYTFDDYVSETTGYDWKEPSQEQIKVINDLLVSIHPHQDKRDYFLQCLCLCLSGTCKEKVLIFTGVGGNGKGLIDDLLLKMTGDLGIIGNNSLLFETSKTDLCPAKVNLIGKRLAVFRELKHAPIENASLKDLSGGGDQSARTLYEKNPMKGSINGLVIIEANNRPEFKEPPRNAETRRIIPHKFGQIFSSNPTETQIKKGIKEADLRFKSKDFQDAHKCALFKILKDVFEDIEGKIVPMPESFRIDLLSYMAGCNVLTNFMEEEYEECPDEIVKVKDIHKDFLESEIFNMLTKTEKKKYGLQKLFKEELVKTSYGDSWFERKQIDGKEYRNILIGFKKIDNSLNENILLG